MLVRVDEFAARVAKKKPPAFAEVERLVVVGVTDIGENHLKAQCPKATTPKKRERLNFRQGDVTRALKGARQAGQVPTRVEIYRDGKISLTFSGEQSTPPSSARDWDEALSNDR